MKWVLLIQLFVPIICTAACEIDPSSINGTYSSLEFNEEGGDLLGIEISITPAPTGYFIVFQSSEGIPRKPVVSTGRLVSDVLTFTVDEGDHGYQGTFRGNVRCDSIYGSFSNGQLSPQGEAQIVLRRGLSYWSRSVLGAESKQNEP